jgi:hypothetical protein
MVSQGGTPKHAGGHEGNLPPKSWHVGGAAVSTRAWTTCSRVGRKFSADCLHQRLHANLVLMDATRPENWSRGQARRGSVSPTLLVFPSRVGSGYQAHAARLVVRDENGSDTNGYHWYYICFHISGRIWIRIQIVSAMPDMIRLDVDIINMRFKYSDTDTVSNVEYSNSDTNRYEPL